MQANLGIEHLALRALGSFHSGGIRRRLRRLTGDGRLDGGSEPICRGWTTDREPTKHGLRTLPYNGAIPTRVSRSRAALVHDDL